MKEKKRFRFFALAWCGWLAGQLLLAALRAFARGSFPWNTAEGLWALPGIVLSLILFFVSVAGAQGNLTWSRPEDGQRRSWLRLCLLEGAFWLLAEGLLILRQLRVGGGSALLVIWSILGVVILGTLILLLAFRSHDRRHPDGKLEPFQSAYFGPLRVKYNSGKTWVRLKDLRFDGEALDCYNFGPDTGGPEPFLARMERLCEQAPALKLRLWPAVTAHLNGIAAEEDAAPRPPLTEAEVRTHTRFFAAHTEHPGQLGLWAVYEPEKGGRQEILIVYWEREDRFDLYKSQLYEWLM